jgi:hypothetical protein
MMPSPDDEHWLNVPIDDYQYYDWKLQCRLDPKGIYARYQSPGMTEWWEVFIYGGTLDYVRYYFSAWADMRVRSFPLGKQTKTRLVKVKVKPVQPASPETAKSKKKQTVK